MVVLASFTQPTDGIRHRQNNTTVYVNDNNLGKGTLYIAESRLSWVSDAGSGFSIEYPHISLHAVSRDLSAFPQECLFLMLDTALGDENERNGDGEDEDENENDEQETTELRLVPDDRGMLDAMFHAMNACQALHPDPEDSFSDEDFYEDADDEIPVEETGSRMASLCIENMDYRGCIFGSEVQNGRGVGRVVDMEEEEEEVEVEEEAALPVGGNILGRGIWGAQGEGAAGNISGRSTWGSRVAAAAGGGVRGTRMGMETGRADGAGDSQMGMGAGRADGGGDTRMGMEGGRVDGAGDSRMGRAVGAGDMRMDTGTGRADAGGDSEVDRVGARAGAGTLGRAGVGAGAGTLGTGVLEVGAEEVEEEEGIAYTGPGMARDGRSYSSGSIWHQGRMARFPQALPHQMHPEEESNFADSEN